MNICTCVSGFGTGPCPVHLPDYTHRAIEAGAAHANADPLFAKLKETIATDAVNTLGQLLLQRSGGAVKGEIVTLESYPKFVHRPGVRVVSSASSLLDFLADRDLERATGSGWGSMTGLHQRRRINISLSTETNWL